MFHFPTFPPHALCVQAWVTGHDPCRVSPFGNPRITARLAAPRGLSQPPTSFIGSWCQGIHRAPLLTWPQRCSRPLCSSQGAGGTWLRTFVLADRAAAYEGRQVQLPSGSARADDRGISCEDPPRASYLVRGGGLVHPVPQDPTACRGSLRLSCTVPTGEAGCTRCARGERRQLVSDPPMSTRSERSSEQRALDATAEAGAPGAP